MSKRMSDLKSKMKPVPGPESIPVYQIKVQGKLNERWSDWLGGVTFSYDYENEESLITTLTVPIADQSALRGILNKLWNLNLTLLSFSHIDE